MRVVDPPEQTEDEVAAIATLGDEVTVIVFEAVPEQLPLLPVTE